MDHTFIYHITPLSNLPRILGEGGLWAKNEQLKKGLPHDSVAYKDLQERRAVKPVICGPGGVLHDYVPFYFGPLSPMLGAIHVGRVDGFDGGQESIIYLCSSAEIIAEEGIPFVFTDGHAIKALTQQYDKLDQLSEVDFTAAVAKYWTDTQEDPDLQRRKQAEFLVHQRCSWHCVRGIGTYNAEIQRQVEQILSSARHTPVVKVHKSWYY